MARRGEVIDRDLGFERIKRETREARRLSIRVGVVAEDAQETYADGAQLVLIAAVNEFGNDRIPSRPALRQAFDNNSERISQTKARLWNGILDGKLTAGRAAEILGQEHENQQRQSIKQLDSPPNAQSTIDAKGSDNPLVDTGNYMQSVRYVVDN